jgi:Flp pilus assembly protein CpaB
VAVPNGRPGLALVRGDEVDVLATFDPAGAAEGAPPTFPVAVAALVVDVGDESAAVAVTPDEAARVAFALASGVVTLALASPVTPADAAISGSSSPEGPTQPVLPPPGR